MGHVLNQTIQDILVRRSRMQGKEVCWVPGIDHASIATEAKVVKELKQRGISKEEIGRAGFLKEAWKWKENYGDIIVTQLKKVGISCDWNRFAFTMQEDLSRSVTAVFVKLYQLGYIYKKKKIIHWDPEGKTALSNEEVIYREKEGKLYYIKYQSIDRQDSVTIATTRPITLLGDTALCVHPKDPRYTRFHGKQFLVPLVNRAIPLITDKYVDKTFGTGCLKVTPAHDVNDYDLALKHKLPVINIFDEKGNLNKEAQFYVGKPHLKAQEDLLKVLEKKGHLLKVTPYKHHVGFSERTGAVVEPRVSTQWFLKMKALAEPAIKSIKEKRICFYPNRYTNTYMRWMENIRDWCISRQLWWGQRIPAYYLPDRRFVVAETREEALNKARKLTGNNNLQFHDLQQDPDVVDTWFSSWLWPISVFGGILAPDNPEFLYYYPTHDLVTAPEIIFFWVARMIMAGYAFTGKAPFRNVYFTGIVRDKKRRKMSKSLGNSPDPIALIEKYGADGVRAGILFSAPAGNDLLFDEKLCEQGNRFMHKIYQALRLVKSWHPVQKPPNEKQRKAIAWFASYVNKKIAQIEDFFADFRLSEALITLYKWVKDAFCAHYLEMIKPENEQKEMAKTIYEKTCSFFGVLMQMLHPFMPFITEEVWQQLGHANDVIMLSPWPSGGTFDVAILEEAQHAFAFIAKIRQLKATHALGKHELLSLFAQGKLPAWLISFEQYIKKATGVTIVQKEQLDRKQAFFIIGETLFSLNTPVQDKKKIIASLDHQQRFLLALDKKLHNSHFLTNAPEAIIKKERKKQQDTRKRIQMLQTLLV